MELNKYPPYLEGTVPAFCYSDQHLYCSYLTSDMYQGGGLRVPYVRNPVIVETVENIKGFCAVIKEAINNEIKCYLKVYWSEDENQINSSLEPIGSKNIISYVSKKEFKAFFEKQEVQFKFSSFKNTDNKLDIGAYYKIQMSYIFTNSIDDNKFNYSSAVLTKFTASPEIFLDLNETLLNFAKGMYVGTYINTDETEPLYSYNFIIRDKNKNIVDTSGWKIHQQSDSKIIFEQKEKKIVCEDKWQSLIELDEAEEYEIYYQVRTINNLYLQSYFYRLKKMVAPFISPNITLTHNLNQEEGYVSIQMNIKTQDEGANVGGNFKIVRSSEDSNYTEWVDIGEINTWHFSTSLRLEDWTVEQGKFYKYALIQYNDKNQVSEKLLSNNGEAIWINFDHMYLSDGEHQLKIKFNPKVSSFKNTILESKQDTIGGKYPFIFRNGQVKYKEFQISGLISYLMDEDENFISWNKIHINNAQNNTDMSQKSRVATTNLVDYNISAEREFKLAVLEWLNNGKPKLFRSATEGNYVVRLMNISLSPDEKLGRMLHTFSATAYEVMPSDYKTLLSVGLAHYQVKNEIVSSMNTVIFKELSNNKLDENWILINQPEHKILSAQFTGMKPGDKIKIDNKEILIGNTGSYVLSKTSDFIYYYKDSNSYYGSVTYHYTPTKIDVKFNHLIESNRGEVLETIYIPFKEAINKETSPSWYRNNEWIEPKPANANFGTSNYFDELKNTDMVEIINGILRQQTYNWKIKSGWQNYSVTTEAIISRIFYAHFYLDNLDKSDSPEHNWIFINTAPVEDKGIIVNDNFPMKYNKIDLSYSKHFILIPENNSQFLTQNDKGEWVNLGFSESDIQQIWIGKNVRVDIYYEYSYNKYDSLQQQYNYPNYLYSKEG